MKQKNEMQKLKDWFFSQRRDLPWRDSPSPYAVWVSEVMLQQTQVAVVIPYFQRWMERFPTISALAQAPIEEVLKEWEGLGYYSRARNLHEGARYVVECHAGELPADKGNLRKIKGLGDYTVGAILNFAFHQKAAAVDGNVLRVLSRYYCLADDICKTKTVKKMQDTVEALLPENEPWVVSEALIELGATLCTKKPKCLECPLNSSCKGFLTGKAQELPVKSVKSKTTPLFRSVAVVVCDGRFLVGKEEKGKIMADLFQFPYEELKKAEVDLHEHLSWIKEKLHLAAAWEKELSQVKHAFTSFRALLIPHLFIAEEIQPVKGYQWHSLEELRKLPFSSGHRQILAQLRE